MAAGDHARIPNGIPGILCRVHFPGLVDFAGGSMPAWTWAHYEAAEDNTRDDEGRPLVHKGARIMHDFWVSLFSTTSNFNASHSLEIIKIMT